LFEDLRKKFQEQTSVDFFGRFKMKEDPLVSEKEHIKMTAYDVWKTTGFRFVYISLFLLMEWILTTQKCTG
jgi:hypothetical protein